MTMPIEHEVFKRMSCAEAELAELKSRCKRVAESLRWHYSDMYQSGLLLDLINELDPPQKDGAT